VALVILVVILLTAGATLLVQAAGRISGAGRLLIAAGMGLVIAWLGIGYVRQLTHPPPPDPTPVQVDPRLRLAYVCEMCGLELAVVMAAKDKAPKHCGEPMVLVRRQEDLSPG
jgi:hypothetical protein